MDSIHPLRRFDLAMAVLLRRRSFMSNADIGGLPQTAFRSETARTYVDLLAQRVATWSQAFPHKAWSLPVFDMTHGTLTFWANARRFRVVLSWGGDGWQLYSQGQLANRRDSLAQAVRWLISGSAPRLHGNLEQFNRVVATLAAAGIDPHDMTRLYGQALEGVSTYGRSAVRAPVCARAASDPLFAAPV